MRIDKFLAQMGVGTRTEVKALLKKGMYCIMARKSSPLKHKLIQSMMWSK